MDDATKVIATNRKARHDYEISDRLEAGLVLQGTEVKSLREGKVNLKEAYCRVEGGEVFLVGANISPYRFGTFANHDPVRRRKLLLNRTEIVKLEKATQQKGYTLVPLSIYFKNGRAKLEVGVGRGKKLFDKRAAIADRENKRSLKRLEKSIARRGTD
ncbi:MAG: SsrA-binding protein SmpB [Bacteroidetes bacterium]|nr:SsrA-binding protein SmpB [Bacteroidota bacterium]